MYSTSTFSAVYYSVYGLNRCQGFFNLNWMKDAILMWKSRLNICVIFSSNSEVFCGCTWLLDVQFLATCWSVTVLKVKQASRLWFSAYVSLLKAQQQYHSKRRSKITKYRLLLQCLLCTLTFVNLIKQRVSAYTIGISYSISIRFPSKDSCAVHFLPTLIFYSICTSP